VATGHPDSLRHIRHRNIRVGEQRLRGLEVIALQLRGAAPEAAKPFPNVAAELDALSRHGDCFRRIIAPEKGDVIYDLCTFLDAFDIRTAYPLLLALMGADLPDTEWQDSQ
jgi:hypothetical protein